MPPQRGHFRLHSTVMPTLLAGRYELRTGQEGLPFTVSEERTHVTVAAPRFTMPTEQILSTFPPANAEGAFGDRLPQIVLKRRTLPWERNPAGGVATSPTPWLALVVVAEGEAQLSTATPVAQCVSAGTTLPDLADDQDVAQGLYLGVTETVVRKIFPCAQDLPLLVHVREVDVGDTELANGDDDGWLAVILANRLPVFDRAAGASVRYMACLVNLEGQLDALPPPTPPQESFVFDRAQDWRVLERAIPTAGPDVYVMGGALPDTVVLPGPQAGTVAGGVRAPRAASGTSAVTGGMTSGMASMLTPGATVGAALDGAAGMAQASVASQWASAAGAMGAAERVTAVARDPDAKRLVRDGMAAGFRLPIEAYARERVLRFPVLAHWSFTTSEGATFESLMQDLDVGLLGTLPERPADAPPAARPDPEVVETGHVGLDHRARRGDRMRAWYRGPLVPFPTRRDAEGGGELVVAHSADQLRRVVPDGREDLALAAAFEIGRLLGLSQLSIVSALLRFRQEQFGAGRVRELLAGAGVVQLPTLVDLTVDLGRFVAYDVLGGIVKKPDDVLGPQRPIADPGREIKVRGALDEMVAVGLGLDLESVRKTGAQVGILAALAQTAAPVASRDGAIPIEGPALDAMRAALGAELSRTLQVAAPQLQQKPVVAPRAGRAGRGAAQAARTPDAPDAPDALDALMARAASLGDDEEDA